MCIKPCYNNSVYIWSKIQALTSCRSSTVICVNQSSIYISLDNFYARCTYGNRQVKGIKIAHFNKGPGYLSTKIHEVENTISGFHPHILGKPTSFNMTVHDSFVHKVLTQLVVNTKSKSAI